MIKGLPQFSPIFCKQIHFINAIISDRIIQALKTGSRNFWLQKTLETLLKKIVRIEKSAKIIIFCLQYLFFPFETTLDGKIYNRYLLVTTESR